MAEVTVECCDVKPSLFDGFADFSTVLPGLTEDNRLGRRFVEQDIDEGVELLSSSDWKVTMLDIFGGGELEGGAPYEGQIGDCGDDISCGAPESWEFIFTDNNHTLLIPEEAIITNVDGNELTSGYVGVFFMNSNGEMQCAGNTQITGGTIQIAAMGDDATTDEIDGLTNDAELVWMVWDCNLETIYSAVTTYSNGPSSFVVNGLSFIESIAVVPPGPSCQTITMSEGWSMFSTYMISEDMDITSVLAPINEYVVIAKDNLGNAYLPEWDFNNIGDMTIGHGYQLKLLQEGSIEICGDYAFPEDNPIALNAGWNMIGYLRLEAAPADIVFASISASGNLVIAKDYQGLAYLPEWNFNGIGDMVPGQGYQLKTNNAEIVKEKGITYIKVEDAKIKVDLESMF